MSVLFPLERKLNTFDGTTPSPHVPARVPAGGTCPNHNVPLFKLGKDKTCCACDRGCVFSITKGGLVPMGGY
jgi:hypothetical protein